MKVEEDEEELYLALEQFRRRSTVGRSPLWAGRSSLQCSGLSREEALERGTPLHSLAVPRSTALSRQEALERESNSSLVAGNAEVRCSQQRGGP